MPETITIEDDVRIPDESELETINELFMEMAAHDLVSVTMQYEYVPLCWYEGEIEINHVVTISSDGRKCEYSNGSSPLLALQDLAEMLCSTGILTIDRTTRSVTGRQATQVWQTVRFDMHLADFLYGVYERQGDPETPSDSGTLA